MVFIGRLRPLQGCKESLALAHLYRKESFCTNVVRVVRWGIDFRWCTRSKELSVLTTNRNSMEKRGQRKKTSRLYFGYTATAFSAVTCWELGFSGRLCGLNGWRGGFSRNGYFCISLPSLPTKSETQGTVLSINRADNNKISGEIVDQESHPRVISGAWIRWMLSRRRLNFPFHTSRWI